MVGKQKRADTTERFCAKAYIVTHVNNENIVISHQIFLMNLVIVFPCSANVLCLVMCPFVSSISTPPPTKAATKFCSTNLANPKLGPVIVQSPVWLLLTCPSLSSPSPNHLLLQIWVTNHSRCILNSHFAVVVLPLLLFLSI